MARKLASGGAALAMIAVVIIGMASSASAVGCGDYPPPATCLPAKTSTNSVTPPAPVEVDLAGLAPNSDGISRLFSNAIFLGTWTANSAGAAHFSVTIPASAPAGQHTLAFTGTDPAGNAITFTAPLTINGSGSGLPLTGAQIGAASVLGLGLLGAGTVAVIAGRRRRTAALPA